MCGAYLIETFHRLRFLNRVRLIRTEKDLRITTRMQFQYTRFGLVAACLAGLWGLSDMPFVFASCTFFVSLLVFGKIESDRNQHDWHFYVQKGHYTHSVIRWLRAYGKMEVLVRSLAVAALSTILFSGTDNSPRLQITRMVFAGSTAVTLVLLLFVQTRLHLIGSRWAYIRGSVIAGILFALLLSFGPSLKLKELVDASVECASSLLEANGGFGGWIASLGRQASLSERWNTAAESMNSLTQLTPLIFSSVLDAIPFVPSWLARFLGTLLSVNLLYGFIVLPYAMLLARICDTGFFKPATPESESLDIEVPQRLDENFPLRRSHS